MSQPVCPYLLDALGRRVPLDRPRTVVGRAPDCDLVLAEARVSRHHAELRREGDGLWLADLGSTNGSQLNGQRLSRPLPLKDGDVLEFGSARFTFHDPEATLDTCRCPRLVLDEASGALWLDRQPLALAPRQLALLRLLHARRGLPCTRPEIARAVWPECAEHINDYQIESLVKRLRHKVEPDPANPSLILTVRGRGYRLSPHALE
jgi:DNA-binding response OmpR family regulator